MSVKHATAARLHVHGAAWRLPPRCLLAPVVVPSAHSSGTLALWRDGTARYMEQREALSDELRETIIDDGQQLCTRSWLGAPAVVAGTVRVSSTISGRSAEGTIGRPAAAARLFGAFGRLEVRYGPGSALGMSLLV